MRSASILSIPFVLSIASLAATSQARADVLLYSNPHNASTTVESVIWSSPPKNVEAADDFEASGSVERLIVDGYGCFQCAAPSVAGVDVRFYAVTPTGPGAEQASYFIPAGTPALSFDAQVPGTLDITLPTPFQAAGKHFVSVRLKMNGSGYWSIWNSNKDHPTGSPLRWRDALNGNEWGPYVQFGQTYNSDLAFQLWGTSGSGAPDLGSDPCGTWLPLAAPNPVAATHAVLRDVVSIAPNDVWAVGDANVPGISVNGESITVTEHFDGTSWSIVPSPSPTGIPGAANDFLWAVGAAASNDVWAGGGQYKQAPDGFYGLHILVERWNGSSWQVMETPVTIGGSGAHVSGIKVFGTNDVWFVGDWMDMAAVGQAAQKALAMHWDGSKFTVFPTPFFNAITPGSYGAGHGMEDADGVAPNDIWAVGGAHDGDLSPVSQILHFDGNEWSRVLGPEPAGWQRLHAVEAIAANDVWAGGEREFTTGGYAPFMIHWNGSSWTEVDCPIGVAKIVAFATDDVYAVGGGVAHWNGTAWSVVETFPTVNGPSLAGVSAAGDCSSLIAVGRQVKVGQILNFSARMVPSPWTDLGGGTTGTSGIPHLEAKGALIAGEPVVLSLSEARRNSPAALVAGATEIAIPLLGGTLFPSPQVVITGIATDAEGGFQVFADWPFGAPTGTKIVLQMLISDPAALGHVALSNALRGVAD